MPIILFNICSFFSAVIRVSQPLLATIGKYASEIQIFLTHSSAQEKSAPMFE
jgi:hypothetical protein